MFLYYIEILDKERVYSFYRRGGCNRRLSIKFEKPKKNHIVTFSPLHHFIADIYTVTLYVFCKFWHIFLHTYRVFIKYTYRVLQKIPTKHWGFAYIKR